MDPYKKRIVESPSELLNRVHACITATPEFFFSTTSVLCSRMTEQGVKNPSDIDIDALIDIEFVLRTLSYPQNVPVVAEELPRKNTTFTRTKMCTFHLRGMCAHGSECKYAHEIQELRDQPDLSKTRMCPLSRKGKCTKGSRCTYAHTRDELRGTDDVYKTAICRFWANGKCVAGEHCRHAHGESELRIRDDILRDDLSRDDTRSTTLTDTPSIEDILQILDVSSPDRNARLEKYSIL